MLGGRVGSGLVAVVLLGACATGSPTSGERVVVLPAEDDEPHISVVQVGHASPAIVVIHGGPGLSHDYLRPEWDLLTGAGRVVYYDQRGCGRSGDGAPYSWRSDVADLDRVVDEVAPDEPVVLAGSSWGSWLALLYALEHPERVRGLLLSGTPPWWHQGPESRGEAEYRAMLKDRAAQTDGPNWLPRADSINAGLDSIHRKTLTLAETLAEMPVPDTMLATRLSQIPQLDCDDAHAARTALWFDIPAVEALADIEVPALLIWGEDDHMLRGGADEIAAMMSSADVQVVDNTGHDPWLERPEDFFALAASFVGAVALETASDGGRPGTR